MAKIGTPYTSNFTGSQVDEAVEKAKTALTINDVQNALGTATDKPISQNLFTETYQYGVRNYAVMPPPTFLLANVVALYSGETQTGGFIQSHLYLCKESSVQGIYEWKDITAQIDIAEGSKTAKGIVQIGNGIDVVNGVISTNKTTIGLGNVDNTSDSNKPISNATQNALNLKLDKSQVKNTYDNSTTNVYSTMQTNSLFANILTERIVGETVSSDNCLYGVSSKVGVESKNIFDKNGIAYKGSQYNNVEQRLFYATIGHNVFTEWGFSTKTYLTLFFYTRPNTTYTYSSKAVAPIVRMNFATINDGGYVLRDLYNSSTANLATFTTTADETGAYIVLRKTDSSEFTDSEVALVVNSAQLELGSKATAYAPYLQQGTTVNVTVSNFDNSLNKTISTAIGQTIAISQYDDITNIFGQDTSLDTIFRLNTNYVTVRETQGTFAQRPTDTKPYPRIYTATDQARGSNRYLLPKKKDGSITANWILI